MDKKVKELIRLYREDERCHAYRVYKYTSELLSNLCVEGHIKEQVCLAALLHDVGKSALSDQIIYKYEPLDDFEWEQVRNHSLWGYRILKDKNISEDISKNVLYHHEDYEGTGYPLGISKNNIPFGARVIRICDTYDAICSNRSYQKQRSGEEAIKIMDGCVKLYDPMLYKAFKEMILVEKANIDREVLIFE